MGRSVRVPGLRALVALYEQEAGQKAGLEGLGQHHSCVQLVRKRPVHSSAPQSLVELREIGAAFVQKRPRFWWEGRARARLRRLQGGPVALCIHPHRFEERAIS